MIAQRYILPATRCPLCGTPPNIRITASERALAMGQLPAVEKFTYQCHRKRCGQIYPVTAQAYQMAA